ncbi:MAG: ABC transporter substrate-binding protein [Candidatus Phytoplasma sp. TWB_XP]
MKVKNLFKKQNTKWFILGFVSVLVACLLGYLVYKSFQGEKYDVKMASGADIAGLDPTKKEHTQTAVGDRLFRCVHDTLLGVDVKTGQLTNKLAKSYTKNGDKVTFELRDDTYFHNGEKVTYEDVEFSVKKGKENKHPQFLNAVKEMKKLENNKFEVTLKNDVVFWDFYFTNLIRILSKKAVEKDGDKGLKVGAGPYKLKQWKQKEFISLELFDKYYDKDFCQKGPKKLLIKVIADQDTVLQELEKGNIDATFNYPSEKINDLKARNPKNLKIVESNSVTTQYCYINKKTTPKNVREAMVKALDVPKYLKDLKLPVTQLESYVPKGLIGYDETLQHHPTDVQGAKNIVNNLTPEQKKLKLVVGQGKPLEVPNKIVEALREVGFTVELKTLEFNTLCTQAGAPDNKINMLFLGESHELLYGHKALEDYFAGEESDNFCHVDDEDVPYLKNKIETAKTTNDLETFKTAVKEANKYVHDQFYVVPLYSQKNYALTTDKIKQGFEYDLFNRFDVTTIKKE